MSRFAAALRGLAEALGGDGALVRRLDRVLAAVGAAFTEANAVVLLLERDAAVLRVAARAGDGALAVGAELRAGVAIDGALAAGGPIELPLQPAAGRRIALALARGGRPLGVLLLEDGAEGAFDAEEGAFLAAVAGVAAAVIHAAELEGWTAEQKRAQARQLESQKMAALVHLVAGITHEMNSPLGAMLSATQTIERAAAKLNTAEPPSPGVLGALADSSRAVRDACQRVDAIVRRLKSFVRLDEAVKQDIGVESCIDAALSLLSHRLERIAIVRDYAETASITCYPARLNEVFSTILRNACDAVDGKEGAKIVVRTRVHRNTVCVEIDDNGVGMSEDEIQRVFEPGFTTKDARVRMGLGLAIAHQVVGDHRGEISFESQIGFGTKVSIELPISR